VISYKMSCNALENLIFVGHVQERKSCPIQYFGKRDSFSKVAVNMACPVAGNSILFPVIVAEIIALKKGNGYQKGVIEMHLFHNFLHL